MPEISPSVLIIRLDAIGDALALTPLLAALRDEAIPVDVVLGRGNAGIYASRAVRRTVTGDFKLRSSDRATIDAIESLGHELQAQRYSHVLVATEDPGGYRLARATRAPVRVGFTHVWGKPFKTLWARRFLTRSIGRSAGEDRRKPHECEVLFRLATPLVGEKEPTRDLTRLRPLVLETEPPPGEHIVVQVTDKWERLGIGFDLVVELVHRIAEFGPIRLLGAGSEAAYAGRIAQATAMAVESFDDLAPWKAAIGAATALVTPDSGALHVAGMVGTPVVAVFPPSGDFASRVARWAPWAAPHRIVQATDGWPARASDALARLL
jgi:ADP-heptose:LPS heptosyltransferase